MLTEARNNSRVAVILHGSATTPSLLGLNFTSVMTIAHIGEPDIETLGLVIG